jgi:hypothetical protein
MFQPETQIKIEQELARGEEARRQGLEGRARVCARRAAGIAVRAYLEGRGLLTSGQGAAFPNAVDLLNLLQTLPGLSEEVRQAASLLLIRVNEAYELPVEADLLEITRGLVRDLQTSASNPF